MKILEIIKEWVIELYNDDKVALVSLIISLIVGAYTWISKINQDKKDNERQKEQDKIAEETRKIDRDFKDFQVNFSSYQQKTNELQFELENRSNLIPYFHLNRTNSRIYLNKSDQLIVEIHLTNVGRGTATNVMTAPMKKDSDENPIYFDQSPYSIGKNTHSIYDYFNENFAIPNDSIFFSLTEIDNNKKQLYFLCFKIRFNDAIGREYEQEFRFGYDNYVVKGINQDSTTYPPELIKDIDK
ncbi:hypothetical protein [Streptococcus ruminantium]|uniref:hypothetical protein n=1 Tax=Streptococcus ruminantium TaxID=1917441 RepID=UPI0012DC05DF|nr:hypothetical protein [Streptococcus ruminantium]